MKNRVYLAAAHIYFRDKMKLKQQSAWLLAHAVISSGACGFCPAHMFLTVALLLINHAGGALQTSSFLQSHWFLTCHLVREAKKISAPSSFADNHCRQAGACSALPA